MFRPWIPIAAGSLLAALAAAATASADGRDEPQDAAAAADAVMQAARERSEADERAARAQLVRESRVLFPQRAGKFELQRSARDPEPENGVVIVYRHDGDFDTDFEIRVWPLGNVAADEALVIGAEHNGTCLGLNTGHAMPIAQLNPWKRRRIELDDGRLLPAWQRLCSGGTGAGRAVFHTLIAYRDFYLIELRIVAPMADARRTAKLVERAGDELFPRIHVQNVGNCLPPTKPKLLIVDEIDRGADRVSIDGRYIYATAKPQGRELEKLTGIAAERRRKTSCVLSFSMASLLPDEKYETLRFPAGSFASQPIHVPAREKED